jgi:hypothetical protein
MTRNENYGSIELGKRGLHGYNSRVRSFNFMYLHLIRPYQTVRMAYTLTLPGDMP